MPSILEVQTAIFSAVDFATALTPIWMNQNAPRPERPYVGMQVLSIGQPQAVYNGESDCLGNVTRLWWHELAITLQVYGSNALSLAYDLRLALDSPRAKEFLHSAKLGVMEFTQVLDTPELLESRYEPRATFEMRLNVVASRTELAHIIEAIELSRSGLITDTVILPFPVPDGLVDGQGCRLITPDGPLGYN